MAYVEELYCRNIPENDHVENEDEVEEYEKWDIILRSEFDLALKDSSNRKASGIERIPVVFWEVQGMKF